MTNSRLRFFTWGKLTIRYIYMRIAESWGDWYLLENNHAKMLLKNGEIGALDTLYIRSYYKIYLINIL